MRTAAVLGAAAALAAVGCSVPLDETAQVVDDSELPESLRPGVTLPTAVAAESEVLADDRTVYLLTTPQDTERTLAVAVTRPLPPDARLGDVLATLFGKSTTPEEADSGYFNTLELFKMNSVSLRDDVATVDIGLLSVEDTPTAEETPPADQLKQAAVQLVFTISDWGVHGTRILLNGEEVSIPTSDADADPGEVLRINAYEQFQPDFEAGPIPSNAAGASLS